MTLNKYNPHSDSLIKLVKLKIPRGEAGYYHITLLPPDKILITGGVNTYKSGYFSGAAIYEDRAEILNIDTGEIKQIANMTYKMPGGKSVVLNDGRILFYFPPNNVNLYIPAADKK